MIFSSQGADYEWCGIYNGTIAQNNERRCGICGPIFLNNIRNTRLRSGQIWYSYEKGSPVYDQSLNPGGIPYGRIAATYKKGQVIDALVDVKFNFIKDVCKIG